MLDEICRQFPTEEKLISRLEKLRWGAEPACPYCGSQELCRNHEPVQRFARWKCKTCNRSFSVTVGTAFHHTHTDLRLWLALVALTRNAEQRLNVFAISRHLGIDRSTVERMLEGVRALLADESAFSRGVVALGDHTVTRVRGNSKRQARALSQMRLAPMTLRVRELVAR